MLNKIKEIEADKLVVKIVSLWVEAGKPRLYLQAGKEVETMETLKEDSKAVLLEAWHLGQEFLEDLKDSYTPLTIIKKIVPYMRKKIRLEADIEENSINEKRLLPSALISFEIQTIDDLNQDYKLRVDARSDYQNLIQLKYENVELTLNKVTDWLLDEQVVTLKTLARKLIALGILTGRRLYQELCFDAVFTPCSIKNHVNFTGQAKGDVLKRDSIYPIRIFSTSPKILIEVYARFRKDLTTFNWYGAANAESVKNKLYRHLTVASNEIVKALGVNIPFEPGKDSRKLYIAIVHYLTTQETNRRIDFIELASNYLGHYHFIKDRNGNLKLDSKGLPIKQKDIVTSRSYNKFEII